MSEFNSEGTRKKRARYDTELESNSVDSKRANSVPESNTESPRVALGPESTDAYKIETSIETEDPNYIPEDILDILNDTDIDSPSHDLDSVIRSFEEEILLHPTSNSTPTDLGYLFGASDDELGLPPTTSLSNEIEAKNDPINLTIENELLSYDSFQLGMNKAPTVVDQGDFVTVDGIFDFSEPSDSAGLTWQPDSLPAL